MDNSVIITLCGVALAAWIAWLIYNYAVFNKQVIIDSKAYYWKNRLKRVQSCVEDLIETIHKKFPNSTIDYIHNDEIDEISGEIKY